MLLLVLDFVYGGFTFLFQFNSSFWFRNSVQLIKPYLTSPVLLLLPLPSSSSSSFQISARNRFLFILFSIFHFRKHKPTLSFSRSDSIFSCLNWNHDFSFYYVINSTVLVRAVGEVCSCDRSEVVEMWESLGVSIINVRY